VVAPLGGQHNGADLLHLRVVRGAHAIHVASNLFREGVGVGGEGGGSRKTHKSRSGVDLLNYSYLSALYDAQVATA
jgi:hypothetical protein